MKTILIALFASACLTLSAQIDIVQIYPGKMMAEIGKEIELAVKDIQQMELEINDLYFDSESFLESMEAYEMACEKHYLELEQQKEQVKIELLEVMESLKESDILMIEQYNKTIERWNETRLSCEKYNIDPLK